MDISTEATAPRPRVLIVDDSRIVRATIIKHLRDRFDVREETDGEAGWAVLLLDPTVQVVISDLSMPKLDGYGLLERVRNSKLSRIREMPVIMISGDEDEASRRRASDLGANDFITKGIGTAELLARLETLVKLSRTHEAWQQSLANAATDHASGLMTRGLLLRQAEQALAFAWRHGGPVTALVIGVDVADGEEAAELLTVQLARLLGGRVRKEDSLARWTAHELAVLSPGIGDAQARAFAERLREAVAQASVHLHGKAVRATVSIGVAHSPADGAGDADVFLAAAEARMARARDAGGNRVVAAEEEEAFAGESIDGALAAIAAGRTDSLRPRLGQLGLRLLPLLRLLEDEYGLGQPIDDMARRLSTGGQD